MPNPGDVGRAVELISKRAANYIYFFENLQDPDWIEPLRERGFFQSPPDAVRVGQGVAYPAWPESEYLLRMAGPAPESVAQVLEQIPLNDNARVHADLARLAARLPDQTALRFASREQKWLHEQPAIPLALPEAVAELADRLAERGKTKAALRLTRALLAIIEAQGPATLGRRAQPKMERWNYERVARSLLTGLTSTVGLEAIKLANDLLDTALALSVPRDKPVDHSDIWRPAIGAHEQNVGFDTRDDLISIIRDLTLNFVDENANNLHAIADELFSREWQAFRRIALWLLAERWSLDRAYAVSVLLDQDYFFDERVLHEYMALTRAMFDGLSEEEQSQWFSLLDKGPRRLHGEVPDDLDADRIEKVWRRNRLTVVGDQLPPNRGEELDRLSEAYGKPEHPTFHSYSTSWVGPSSPLDAEELASREPQEIVRFLAEWEPAHEMYAPSPEGLGRLYADRVAADPAGFAELSPEIAKLDPTYVRFTMHGLREGAKQGRTFDWEAAIMLIETAGAERSREDGQDLDDDYADRDRDPGWEWGRTEALRLLELGLAERTIPLELSPRVWHVLKELSWDPEPTPEYERQYGGSNMDPLSLSLNTVRGQAMHAVIQFAVWQKQEGGNQALVAEALENIADHLEPERERSETVRGVLGFRLNQLHWIDPDWVATHVDAIFPLDRKAERLRFAAWQAYLGQGRIFGDVTALLGPQYDRAVEDLPTSNEWRARAGKDPGLGLAEHLAVLYWHQWIPLEGGVLERFFERASAPEAEHFVDFVGRSLHRRDDDEPVAEDVKRRVQELWDQVKEWTRARSAADRRGILGPFGWWYGSGELDPAWADGELVSLLRDGIDIDPDFAIFERLNTRARENLGAALTVAHAFVDNASPTGWALLSVRDDLRSILRRSFDDADLREETKVVIDALIAKGLTDFGDLLK